MSEKKAMDIEGICQSINSHLKRKFGIGVEKTVLYSYNSDEWKKFIEDAGLTSNYAGFYSIATGSAHIPEEHPRALQMLYHEYFGHGIYQEHTENGRRMYRLERELQQKRAEYEDEENEETAEARKLRDSFFENISLESEAFAVWMQYYLSIVTDTYESFKEAFIRVPSKVREASIELIKLSNEGGATAVFEKYRISPERLAA